MDCCVTVAEACSSSVLGGEAVTLRILLMVLILVFLQLLDEASVWVDLNILSLTILLLLLTSSKASLY